jgi:hypothetical protein
VARQPPNNNTSTSSRDSQSQTQAQAVALEPYLDEETNMVQYAIKEQPMKDRNRASDRDRDGKERESLLALLNR